MKQLTIIFLLLSLVFSGCSKQPTEHFNIQASVLKKGQLTVNPLLLYAVTTGVNNKTNTMFTLYANDIAARNLVSKTKETLPQGAELYEVTWNKQPDAVWYGAEIPDKLVTIERVSVTTNGVLQYSSFDKDMQKKAPQPTDASRVKILLAQTLAVSP